MKLARRAFLRLTAGAAALVLPRIAHAEIYPSRPVRIVVGLGPGSASDILARLIGHALSKRLGQPFVIENREGAGGILAAAAVVRAAPDGYTLLYCGAADVTNSIFRQNLSFDFFRDIAPVASVASGPLVLVVNPSFPAKTVQDFIAYAKANPDKISFGSAGIGTVAHLAGELFKAKAGIDMVHVPYRGLPPALTDLIGGRVQAVFSTTPPAIGYLRAGKLRALGVTSATRFGALPDVPPIGDSLPGYEASIFNGLGAPNHTPREIIDRLNNETDAALADGGIKARLADLGSEPLAMTSPDFGKLLAAEGQKWAKVMREAGIKAK